MKKIVFLLIFSKYENLRIKNIKIEKIILLAIITNFEYELRAI